MNVYSVVLAGGGGTRFWPLSRQCKPKQVLNLSGHDTMINETVKRMSDLIPQENVYIVTNKSQGTILREVLSKEVPDKNILMEPVGRNTAACIGLAAMVIQKRHGESIICISPSDAYIGEDDNYEDTLRKAFKCSEENESLVTIGIKPSYPATGYGYINFNRSLETAGAYSVEEFVEKPDLEKAKKFLKNGDYLWNSGILVCRTSILLDNIKRFLPRLFNQLEVLKPFIDTEKQDEMLEAIYPTMQSISIDYGILERSDKVLVIPGDFSWNDVGSWDSFAVLFPPDENGNIIKTEHIGIDTKNSIIYGSNKLVATIGIDQMIIVNTEDALLICPKSRAQEVKNIVELLKLEGRLQYL